MEDERYYDRERDPAYWLERLKKNLRLENVLNDDELASLPNANDIQAVSTFEDLLTMITTCRKEISPKQFALIVKIGSILGSPEHMFDYLKKFVRT